MKDSCPLQSKVALVTGSSKRIGAMIVRNLHTKGYEVAIHYRNSVSEAQHLADNLNRLRANSAIIVSADLSQENAPAELVEPVIQRWGRLDALVNNASDFYPTPIGEIKPDDWDRLFSSNARGPLFLSQYAAPYLKKAQGSIVNIVDIHAQKPLAQHPVYCMAKAALAMMTLSLAKELGPEVRVNGVSPGAILWPENEMSDQLKQELLERTSLKRQGSPDDIVETVVFLLDQARYISGQILAVDGGRTLNM